MVKELELYLSLLFSKVNDFPVEIYLNLFLELIEKFNVKALKLKTLDTFILAL